MIRILVVDDHRIFRQGIVTMLRSQQGFQVVAEAGTGKDAIAFAERLQPDVILMDVSLPDIDGIETSRRIAAAGIDTSVILLTMYKEAKLMALSKETGIMGYILKNDALDDLLYAINAVLRGEQYLSASLSTESFHTATYPAEPCPLTGREKEIVTLVAQGLTSKEIGEKLFVSTKTVETHRANIMEKLQFKGIADMVRYAVRTGLIEP